MAAVPFYIVIGDEQVTGASIVGLTPQPGVDGTYWTTYANRPLLMQTVPTTGSAYAPFWDGSYPAQTNVGGWVKYHHTSYAHQLAPIVANANGDNWYWPSAGLPITGGGFGPTTLLMQLLKQKHAASPYFKLFKYHARAGFGQADGFKATGTSFTAAMAELDKAVTAMGSDTPDYRGIVLDASVSDIRDENLTYSTDVASCIAGIRAHIGDTASEVPVYLVNHAPEMLQESKLITIGTLTDVPAAQFVRGLNASLAATLTNVRLVDMNGAGFSANAAATYNVVDTDPEFYETNEYLELGQKIYNAIEAFEAATPTATPGSGIATYFLLGDSQAVGNLFPLHAILGGQESILGASPGTVRSGQYVWNDVAEEVQLYDVTANANTWGTSTNSYYGPEATLLKRLADEHPDGVLLIKLALSGCALTLEGVAAGAPNSFEESAGTVYTALQTGWNKAKIDCITNLNRVPDVRGVAVMIGDNDTYDTASATAFGTKLGTWVDSLRASLTTRADGEELAFAFHLPPKHLDSGGASVLGIATARETVRGVITALAAADDRITAVSDADLELMRADSIHYGAEAQYEIGYRLADALIALETEGGTTTTAVDSPSGTAAFTVETGSGATDSNSYCSVADADTYHAAQGNPSDWIAATTLEKQDALRQATTFLDYRYGNRWHGLRATSEQSLDWPRSWASDSAGNDIASDEIPVRLARACAVAALLHVRGETLLPTTETSADIDSESNTVGAVSRSVTYRGGKPSQTKFPIVDRILASAGLIGGGGGWGSAVV